MGDMREVYNDMKQHKIDVKDRRRNVNLQFLTDNNISWTWIDQLSDHILIDGVVDYYLGKTYWHNRKTKKHGYAMLCRLMSRAEGAEW